MTVQDLYEVIGYSLTEEQLAAVTAPLEPAVVVAGAGTGKTTVMAARVVWLVGTGQVLPGEVLGLTFTNKAASELAGRVRTFLRKAGFVGASAPAPIEPGAALTDTALEPTVVTYHSYAGGLLREHGLRIGVEPGARLLADATRFQVATRVVGRHTGRLRSVSHSVPVVVDEVLALDGELAEHLVSTDSVRQHDRALIAEADAWLAARAGAPKKETAPTLQLRQTAQKRLELVDLVDELRAERRRIDALDFADQMRLAADLVRECPPVVEQERAAYRVVLLDEYQDTSVAQRVLLQSLFGEGHAVTAVGDPCQAIYGWRGASVQNIDGFPQDFAREGGAPAARFVLTVNNRSDEAILDLANVLSEPLREIHPGVAALRPRADRVGDGSVITAVHATHQDEVEWIADHVQRIVAGGEAAADDVAVLLRTWRDAAPLREALLERDLPVDVVGLGGLLDVPEVADVLATLEVLDDPTANPSLLRLLAGPRWRIGIRDLRLLGRRAVELGGAVRRDVGDDASDEERIAAALAEAVAGIDPAEVVSLADAVEDPGGLPFSAAARERFARFATELRELRRHHAEPAADLIGRVVTSSGIGVEVASLPHGDGGSALAQLGDVAAQFSDLDGGNGLRSFLAFTRAARRHDRGLEPVPDATEGGVKLLTAHKAKGLEFPVVFVPMLTVKVFPSEEARECWTRSAKTIPGVLRGDAADRPALAGFAAEDHAALKEADRVASELEERRLIYVAATRAERTLVLSGHWWGATQKKVRGPSSYLRTALTLCASTPDQRSRVVVDVPRPADGEANPQVEDGLPHDWPAPLEPSALAARRALATAVSAARGPGRGDREVADPAELDTASRALVASWDRDLEVLLREARLLQATSSEVPVPPSLSATTSLRLMRDPSGFAAELARPMPRPPAPAANRGTRFHAWVEEHFGTRQLGFADLEEPDPLDGDPTDHLDDLASLKQAFLVGPFATRRPAQVEAPFGITVGGLVIRGRIDAVYDDEPGARYLVVDWKTGTREPDPLQLAVYRIACAELHGVDVAEVRAAFYVVPTGEVRLVDDLPTRAELEQLLVAR